MNIFDTHCHYNLEPFLENWQSHWEKAREHGVVNSTVVGVDLETSKQAVKLAEENSSLHAAVGLHPNSIVSERSLQSIKADVSDLEAIISNQVVAIGETGLDYFRLPTDLTAELIRKTQKAAFTAHIQLAQKKELPLIIHVRDTQEDAYWDVLTLLKEQNFNQPFVLHCASGPTKYIQQALQLGAYIGLAGNITYKNSSHLRDLVEFTPSNKIVLETDAPFLPPVSYRGKTCEPWMIGHTATFCQDELRLDLQQIYQNSLNLFQID